MGVTMVYTVLLVGPNLIVDLAYQLAEAMWIRA
jgi:ABC-type dipeptide/oligopeptide/nickel transport system permease component